MSRYGMLSALALAGGCSFAIVRPTPSPATTTKPASCRSMGWVGADLLGGLVVAAAGKLTTVSVHDDPNGPDRESQYYYYAAAGVLGASAIYGLVANVVCTGRVDAIDDAASRSAAHDLHMRASDAARAGDCTVARELDAQIRQQDAEYYRDVFRLDVAIQRCLEAPDSAPR